MAEFLVCLKSASDPNRMNLLCFCDNLFRLLDSIDFDDNIDFNADFYNKCGKDATTTVATIEVLAECLTQLIVCSESDDDRRIVVNNFIVNIFDKNPSVVDDREAKV